MPPWWSDGRSECSSMILEGAHEIFPDICPRTVRATRAQVPQRTAVVFSHEHVNCSLQWAVRGAMAERAATAVVVRCCALFTFLRRRGDTLHFTIDLVVVPPIFSYLQGSTIAQQQRNYRSLNLVPSCVHVRRVQQSGTESYCCSLQVKRPHSIDYRGHANKFLMQNVFGSQQHLIAAAVAISPPATYYTNRRFRVCAKNTAECSSGTNNLSRTTLSYSAQRPQPTHLRRHAAGRGCFPYASFAADEYPLQALLVHKVLERRVQFAEVRHSFSSSGGLSVLEMLPTAAAAAAAVAPSCE